MLYCTLLMLQGAGQGSLKCKTQPHVGTAVRYALYNLPLGGTLLVGDAVATHAMSADVPRGEWSLPPLAVEGVWAAYLSPDGEVLARGATDGVWREAYGVALWQYAREVAEKAAKAVDDETPAPHVVDLADYGVVAVDETPVAQIAEDVEGQTATTPEQTPAQEALRLEDLGEMLAHFEDYPPYTPLEALVPGSRWVRVGEQDAYLLGLLYDSTPTLTHVCYGVEGTKDRPFLPEAEWLAAEEEEENGYWIVYRQVE